MSKLSKHRWLKPSWWCKPISNRVLIWSTSQFWPILTKLNRIFFLVERTNTFENVYEKNYKCEWQRSDKSPQHVRRALPEWNYLETGSVLKTRYSFFFSSPPPLKSPIFLSKSNGGSRGILIFVMEEVRRHFEFLHCCRWLLVWLWLTWPEILKPWVVRCFTCDTKYTMVIQIQYHAIQFCSKQYTSIPCNTKGSQP